MLNGCEAQAYRCNSVVTADRLSAKKHGDSANPEPPLTFMARSVDIPHIRPKCLVVTLDPSVTARGHKKVTLLCSQRYKTLYLVRLGQSPGNAQNEPSEVHSGNFWARGPEMLKMSLLRLILATSGPRPGNAQNEPSEAHSGYFWAQGPEMLKMNLLRLIFATSGPKG